MAEVRYCPECNTEYYAHIKNCADCGAILLSLEELNEFKTLKTEEFDTNKVELVVVREGEKKWIKELYDVLSGSGFTCKIISSAECTTDCKPGKCGDTFLLLVPKENLEKALQRIDSYFEELHPELREANELIANGKCPACGFDAGAEAQECPDCGLLLLASE